MSVNIFGESPISTLRYEINNEIEELSSTFISIQNGTLNMNNNTISNLPNPVNSQEAATKAYVDTNDLLRVMKSGDTMTGVLNMSGNNITGLPTSITDLTSDSSSISKKVFIDVMNDALALKLNKSGGTMSGNLIMGGYFINNIHDPMLPNDAVTLGYLGTNYVNKVGDTMSGSLTINNPTGNSSMGCLNLSNLNDFTFNLGDSNNEIFYHRNDSNPLPIYFTTSNGIIFSLGINDILRIGKDAGDLRIVALQPIILNADPTDNFGAATKRYVDNKRVCNNVGYIPILSSNLTNRNGFIISASSEYSTSYQAYNVTLTSATTGSGTNEWATYIVTTNFWIQVQLPISKIIWKFQLNGRTSGSCNCIF